MRNHSTPSYTFKQFNDEINEFYRHLQDSKFTNEEIRKILSPLRKDTKRIKFLSIIAVSFSIVTMLYFLTYIEVFSWHLSALGRIFLIKLLPFWNWTVLKTEKCLLPKSASSTTSEITFNCNLCENINQIDVYDNISEDMLKTHYLDLDVPVIVKKKVENWPTSEDFIDILLTHEEIILSKPCSLATNIHNGLTTVKNLLTKAPIFDSFFIHFQNCDFHTMKQFRSMTPRPQFLPPELSPVQYNWLLWSRNYNVSAFKPLNLVEKIALIRQIAGSNFIRLVPRNNCELECPQINIKLHEEESIIFTSLWDLEYRPGDGENIAVVLEMH